MRRQRRVAILLVCFVLISGILSACSGNSTSAASAAEPTATATLAAPTATPHVMPTATPSVSALARVDVLGGVLCQENVSCQNYTTHIIAGGPFAVMWLCFGKNWTGDSVSLAISVYNGVGRQIDSLNESCPGNGNAGTILENQPAGTYSVSLTTPGGPAASVVVIDLYGEGSPYQ